MADAVMVADTLEAVASRPLNAVPRTLARNGLIVTRTPLRISFAGGGTDLPAFYLRHAGAVLSTTIDKYVYVTVKRHDSIFGSPIRLNYSETEQVNRVEEIRNDIARACFEFLGADPPIYMSTVADLPAASGMGSSSAFCVGLLHALHAWRGEHPSAGQLAEEAAHVEINMLRRPIGKQDQYAAAYGGFNLLRFLPTGGVSVESQQLESAARMRLFDHLMMFWTGVMRDAAEVLAEQSANIELRIAELSALRDQAEQMQSGFCNRFCMAEFGKALDVGWLLKRRLASTISNPRIDAWYERARAAGAWGGKLCGAGGGGFFLFVAPPERRQRVRAALSELCEVPVQYEPQGSRLLTAHLE